MVHGAVGGSHEGVVVFIKRLTEDAQQVVSQAEDSLQSTFQRLETLSRTNTQKVLHAFWAEQVSEADLYGSTGYGYGDHARDKLERVFARVFGGQSGIVRPQIVSGTHALKLALFGLVRPGHHIVIATGQPYDTLEGVLGLRATEGSLADWGIQTSVVPLTADGSIHTQAVMDCIRPETTLVMLQKSRGYQDRMAFSVSTDIHSFVQTLKGYHPHVMTLVDNCYGEFTETLEPCDVGVDVIAGSLIKNPGAGLARTGGYIVGQHQAIHSIGAQVIAPGVGLEAGPTNPFMREFFQGLFLAPHTVGQALKTSLLLAKVLSDLGYEVSPRSTDPRYDLILSVTLKSKEALLALCRAIQQAAPIDAHVVPYEAPMPGYEDPVVMAAGSFIQGSSIDLSADGPIRPPYTAYIQGGLTYEHGYIATVRVVEALLRNGPKE